MSNSRQRPSVVRSYSITHPPGRVALPTAPGWDQIVFAPTGLFTAHSESRAWTIPAHRALCVPDGSRLRIDTARRTAIRCLYTTVELRLLGAEIRVVNLDPLTHQLITHAIDAAPMNLEEAAPAAVITLLADQLSRLPDTPLQLPLPVDPVAKTVATAIMAQPAVSLDEHIRNAAASRRTLERRFTTETRMSLGQWRRRACILAAVAMLADGDSVTSVALRVGYASPSSFIAAFRAELDSAPREFMRTAASTDRAKLAG
jgi:AraC-like DNA-binding protein